MRSKISERMLLVGMLMLCLPVLTGCGTKYINAENKVVRSETKEGMWLISDAALIDLLDCCDKELSADDTDNRGD